MNDIPPEVLAQIIRQGGLEQRNAMLQKQLEELHSQPQVDGGHHSTGWGAALGGLGNLFGTVGEEIQGKRLQDKLDANMSDQDAARQAAAEQYQDSAHPDRYQDIIGSIIGGTNAQSPLVASMGATAPQQPAQQQQMQPNYRGGNKFYSPFDF